MTTFGFHTAPQRCRSKRQLMHLLRQISPRLICVFFFLCSGEGYAREPMKTFSDEHVAFCYPENRYSSVRFGDVTGDDFYTYYLRVKGSDAVDVLTICQASLSRCGQDTGSVKPYWYSGDGSLMLFSATTTVKEVAVGSGDVAYEAFPACPATDNEGASAYGGDCYELVEGSRNKTLSMTYWIGAQFLHRPKSDAVRQARIVLKSVVVK